MKGVAFYGSMVMGMDTVCRIVPEAPQVRASRFMRRYAACRDTLTGGKNKTDKALTASAAVKGIFCIGQGHRSGATGYPQGAPERSGQSFLQLYLQAFAAARQ